MKYKTEIDFIDSVIVPKKTASYSPVAHKDIIDSVKEQLDKFDHKIIKTNYLTAKEGKQLIGRFIISSSDSEIYSQILFKNSYDKSMSLGFTVGAEVSICSNGMIFGDTKIVRRHTGKIAKELNNKINEAILTVDYNFRKIQRDKDRLAIVPVSLYHVSQILGEMFVDKNIISSNQINSIKKELYVSEHFKMMDKKTTLWNFYNNCTEVFKNSHPLNYIKNHRDFHNYIMTKA